MNKRTWTLIVIAAAVVVGLTAGRAQAQAWSPTNVPNLALWLDGSDSNSMTIAGGAVSQWNDKSGKGRNLTQATGTKQPTFTANALNGLSALSFNPANAQSLSNSSATINLSTPIYRFIVCKFLTKANKSVVFDSDTQPGQFVFYNGESGTKWVIGCDNSYTKTIQYGTNDFNNHIHYSCVNSASSYYSIDGALTPSGGDPGANGMAGIRIGNVRTELSSPTYAFQGYVYEVILATSLTDSDRQKIEGYLAWKWGLQGNLPAGHPYQLSAPRTDSTGYGGVITYTDSNGQNPVSSPPYANGYVVHTFTNSGTLNVPTNVSASVLVVGGGGGGGASTGGGGGAGGFIYSNSFSVAGDSNYTVTVGAGGGGGAGVQGTAGTNGSDSVFGSLRAYGGGGGGANNTSIANGLSGGSGGGAANTGAGSAPACTPGIPGACTNGQGYAGGSNLSWGTSGYYTPGGGGGGGSVGTAGNSQSGGAAGGLGVQYSISGSNRWYCGGGGGGVYQVTGNSGGGAGGSGIGGVGGCGPNSQTNATAGAANTGSGGGGQGGNPATQAGSGGSGIVIVRYLYVSGLSIALSSPTAGQGYPVGSSITATATVSGGTAPYSVTFYTNSGSGFGVAGTMNTFPYTNNLGMLPAGSYSIYATVSDNVSSNATSTTNAFTVFAPATSFFWTNAASGAWSTGGNWTNEVGTVQAPFATGQTNYTLSFNEAGTITATNNLNNGFLLNQLNFGGATATLAGNSLALTNSGGALPQVNQNSAAAVTISNNVALGANATFGGSGAGTVTVAGAISGAGALAKTSSGQLTLSGDNSLAGLFSVQNGTVVSTTNWVGNNRPRQQVQVGGYGSAAVWTNTLGLMLGNGAAAVSNTFMIADQGALQVNGVSYIGTNGAAFNSLVLTNGGQFASGSGVTVGSGANSNSVTVYSNSLWSLLGSTATLGNGTAVGNQLVVNGGTLSNTVAVIGNSSGSIGNSLTINNGGQFVGGNAVTVGNASGANNNGYNVGGLGAPSTVSNSTLIVGNGANYNTMTVTNASLWSGALTIGNGAAANNTVSVLSNATWNLTGNAIYIAYIGNSAVSNSLTVNGGTVTNASSISVGYGANSTVNHFFNSLVVTNGGRVFVSGAVWVPNQPYSISTRNQNSNSLVIADGGLLSSIGGGVGGNTSWSVGNYNTLQVSGGGVGRAATWNLGGGDYMISSAGNCSFNSLTLNGAGVAGGAVMTNVGAVTINGTANSIVLTNGAQMFSTNTVTLGNGGSGNNATLVGGAANSMWNAGGQTVYAGSGAGAAYNQLLIGNGGVLTNVGTLMSGYATGTGSSNQLVVRDGGKVFAGVVCVGYDAGAAGGVANSNSLLIASGGVVSVAGAMYVGAFPPAWNYNHTYNNNTLTITNGGQLFTAADSHIGTCIGNTGYGNNNNNNNAVTLSGSLNGTNATWDLGGKILYVGGVNASLAGSTTTNNSLTVMAGGVVTNLASLVVKATNTLALGAGGQIYASAATNAGTLTVNLDDAVTPSCGRLTVGGNLNITGAMLNIVASETPVSPVYVIASYGSLTGSFAATNGLPSGYTLATNYNSAKQIALVATTPCTVVNLAPTGLSPTSAVFNVRLSAPATSVDLLVYWGPTDGTNDPTAWTNSAYVGTWANVALTNISFATNGFNEGSTYYYTFRATNNTTSVWASPSTNFTSYGPPTVDNAGGAVMQATSATLRGRLTGGGVADAYVCWAASLPGAPDSTGAWANVLSIGPVTQGAVFSTNVTGLNPLTTYYYRCYVTNAVADGWSAVTNFATLPTSARNMYWSGNGSSHGANGTWNTAGTNWGTAAGGPFSNVWNNDYIITDTAVFGGTAGTVTLGTAIQACGVSFGVSGYTLRGANTLTLGTNNALAVGTSRVTLADGVVVTNVAAVTTGAGGSLALTNGAWLCSAGTVQLGNAANGSVATLVGGAANSMWNVGGAAFYLGYSSADVYSNQVVIGAGGIVTNVGSLQVGREHDAANTAYNNSVAVTNGGQLFTVGSLYIGRAEATAFSAASNAKSNALVIAGGGSVNVGGGLYVGSSGYLSGHNASYNSAAIGNGGQLFTKADSYIGVDAVNYTGTLLNNNLTIGGSQNGTNATWDLGGTKLYIGYLNNAGSVATNNSVTVNSGGVVTNLSALTVRATNSLTLGAGGRIYANSVTNAGTVTVGLDDGVTPGCGRLTVAGNLNITGSTLNIVTNSALGGPAYVIATYGTLTGTFAATNGLPNRCILLYNYDLQNAIAIVPGQGTVFKFR